MCCCKASFQAAATVLDEEGGQLGTEEGCAVLQLFECAH
jgi:hypothetical protein